MTMTLVFTLLERESSCLQNAMILVIQNAVALYPQQCLFGILVSCGSQRVTAEALKYCNILPGFQKIYSLLTFCRPSGFLKLIFFEKNSNFKCQYLQC